VSEACPKCGWPVDGGPPCPFCKERPARFTAAIYAGWCGECAFQEYERQTSIAAQLHTLDDADLRALEHTQPHDTPIGYALRALAALGSSSPAA